MYNIRNVGSVIFVETAKNSSSGSSSRVEGGGGGEKHEIYAAEFGGHLFYDLFLQGRGGGHGPSAPPGSATELKCVSNFYGYRSSLSRPTDGASSESRPQQTNVALALALASDETPRLTLTVLERVKLYGWGIVYI